jgi:hypothetical protein
MTLIASILLFLITFAPVGLVLVMIYDMER